MAKCNMDCFNCTRPVEKCHGGNGRKSATPWKNITKRTSVGKGDPGMGRSWTGNHRASLRVSDDEDPNNHVQ